MTRDYQARLDLLKAASVHPAQAFRKGIEREGLRADRDVLIAQTPHPMALGAALTHPSITTDYSEALLELITGVATDTDALMGELSGIHRFVQSQLGDEILWAGSMPCRLNGEQSIPIADYGRSNLGQFKHVYRQGLGVRYGRIMQSIAGLHYNFSLTPEFLCRWINALGEPCTDQEQVSEQFFRLIRNFRRQAWLLMYLFGASPVLDETFLDGRPTTLQPYGKRTRGLPWATSLRMGDLGYHNKAQAGLDICFNRLSTYVKTLFTAARTPYPAYEAIGVRRGDQFIQLSPNILQIENEYYSPIRPKRTARAGERPLKALQARGVEYVEVRCLDINPFLPFGIDATEADFLDVFLLHCLIDDSPIMGEAACREADENFRRTVREGRKPGLTLLDDGVERELAALASERLAQMSRLALQLDEGGNARFAAAVQAQRAKVDDVALTPSAQVMANIAAGADYLELMRSLSIQHQQALRAEPLSPAAEAHFADAAKASMEAERQLVAGDTVSFETFLNQVLN